MNQKHRLLIAIGLIVLSTLYVFPWDKVGITPPAFLAKPFTLGLDLQGWVELDYRVDLDALKMQSGTTWNEQTIIEGLKGIVDKRVMSLGLTGPNIQSARYGGETHIIVQIPTVDYGNISESEKRDRTKQDIARAKEVIGKVVQLEFRERKTTTTDEDKAQRKGLADAALAEIGANTPFATVGAKYRDQFENVGYLEQTGPLIKEATFEGVDWITTFPYTSNVYYVSGEESLTPDENGNPVTTRGPGGYVVTRINSMTEKEVPAIWTGSATKEKEYSYSLIYVDERPSEWTAAKTADGKVLNDKYLQNAGVGFTQVGEAQVQLLFNEEGKKIFAELTKRLKGKEIAIFVGGELLTAPTVQEIIPDGMAVISGGYTIDSAQKLANDINTGIVPAPIYLTSERAIDAKIWSHALGEILNAGLIGLVTIVIFLTYFYRASGLLAGIALVAYTLFLVALVKFFGAVLTLASIAGAILSIWLAIDANILIFERMREAFREGETTEKVIKVGFDRSWTAIWDSHITSLTSAVILYIFGISMIKGFWFMLGLGIVLSLFTAMWVSRILIISLARTKIGANKKWFVGA
jgi:protein-export membrane protein SecD